MKTKTTKVPSHGPAVEDLELYDAFRDVRYCRCGARMDHPRHDMPETTAEQRAHDAALLGERPEADDADPLE